MIPIAQPEVGEAEANAAAAVVLSGWLTPGPPVALFEKEFAELVGADRFAVTPGPYLGAEGL